LFLSAKVVLPYFFSNNMVLQQQTKAAIWGSASPSATVSITPSWNKKKYTVKADINGKWKTALETPVAGGPYSITVSDGEQLTLSNILIGEVWLCSGQSNMEMPMKGYKDQPIINSNDVIFNSTNDQLRFYVVPRSAKLTTQDTSKKYDWKIAGPETTSGFSATAYYFGKLLQQRLQVPVGLVNISYGGSSAEAWMSKATLQELFPEIKIPDTDKPDNRTPTALYNGMLHPFTGFTIKGCIWYQGESNYERPEQYETLFPTLVNQWRREFGQGDFPFYFAQIAPYNYAQLPPYNSGGKYNSAYLRDAQRKAVAKISNSGMVVLLDAGEENSIHPANKEVVGKRFAYLALAQTYQQQGFAYTSPSLSAVVFDKGVATLSFNHAPNGFTSFGKPLLQFEVAGADKFFRPAKASIVRGAIVVSAPEVKEPIAVRYAFKDFVIGDLFSTEGFPVSSFRTDDW
jgi:sialate O-acetylesterase